MQVGDILGKEDLYGLPVGAVAVYDEKPGQGHNTLTRTREGYVWVSMNGDGFENVDSFDDGEIVVDGWKVVHLPELVPPHVGDAIRTKEQAAALPVGSVLIDTADTLPSRAVAVKVGPNKWLFQGAVPPGAQYATDDDVYGDGEDIVVHLPGAGRRPERPVTPGADRSPGRPAA